MSKSITLSSTNPDFLQHEELRQHVQEQKHFDDALKDELNSSLYIFYGNVNNLEQVAEAVFKKCRGGENPLYKKGASGGWREWPSDAKEEKEEKELRWLEEQINTFLELAKESQSVPNVEDLWGNPVMLFEGLLLNASWISVLQTTREVMNASDMIDLTYLSQKI